jgi:hypothetical protein
MYNLRHGGLIMLAPEEAIGKARNYLGEVVPEYVALEPKVEEIECAPNSSEWKITFSAAEGKNDSSLAALLRGKVWKVVTVGAEDGSLIAVKNPSSH